MTTWEAKQILRKRLVFGNEQQIEAIRVLEDKGIELTAWDVFRPEGSNERDAGDEDTGRCGGPADSDAG